MKSKNLMKVWNIKFRRDLMVTFWYVHSCDIDRTIRDSSTVCFDNPRMKSNIKPSDLKTSIKADGYWTKLYCSTFSQFVIQWDHYLMLLMGNNFTPGNVNVLGYSLFLKHKSIYLKDGFHSTNNYIIYLDGLQRLFDIKNRFLFTD